MTLQRRTSWIVVLVLGACSDDGGRVAIERGVSLALGRHRAATIRDVEYECERPELAPRLRQQVLQTADPLFRSADIVRGSR